MRPWKKIIYIFLLVTVCVAFFNFGRLNPAVLLKSYNSFGSYNVIPNFALLWNSDGVAYGDEQEQWRADITTNHKGGIFCGTSYSKEMAIFNQTRINPLSKFKNPCWYDEKEFRCFPYFFMIGASKTGTSDLYARLANHPHYVTPVSKEPNWFSQKLFIEKMDLRKFLKTFYTKASQKILEASKNYTNDTSIVPHITGDASTTYIFYHDFWPIMPGNTNLTEPLFTNAHYMHHFNPNAKIIVSVRNPIDRLWSGFLYVSRGPKNAQVFHNAVIKAVGMYNDCLRERSARSCVYDKKLYLRSMSVPVKYDPRWRCPLTTLGYQMHLHLRIGMYAVFLRDYFTVFPRQQIFIQRLEDRKDMKSAMREIFTFLEMGDPSDLEMKRILNLPKANVRSKTNVKIGDMYNETRQILYDFYRPFNEELAQMFGNEKLNYGIR